MIQQVIRSGRLLPVDNVETAMCPMISVLPMRVNFLSPGDVLQIVQSTISSVVELEHVPLGKVQSWVRPGKPLFETLFSVSMKDTTQSAIWDVVESEPPQADVSSTPMSSFQHVTDKTTVHIICRSRYRS